MKRIRLIVLLQFAVLASLSSAAQATFTGTWTGYATCTEVDAVSGVQKTRPFMAFAMTPTASGPYYEVGSVNGPPRLGTLYEAHFDADSSVGTIRFLAVGTDGLVYDSVVAHGTYKRRLGSTSSRFRLYMTRPFGQGNIVSSECIGTFQKQ